MTTAAPGPARVEPQLLELSRGECLELLGAHGVGRVSVIGAGKAPVIRPVNYLFDRPSQAVVFRTAAGSKFHALVRATHAAFEIDSVDPRTRTGWSVVVVGVTEQVTSPAEVRRLNALGLDPWPGGTRRHWIRIRAGTVSGRRISGSEASDGSANR